MKTLVLENNIYRTLKTENKYKEIQTRFYEADESFDIMEIGRPVPNMNVLNTA